MAHAIIKCAKHEPEGFQDDQNGPQIWREGAQMHAKMWREGLWSPKISERSLTNAKECDQGSDIWAQESPGAPGAPEGAKMISKRKKGQKMFSKTDKKLFVNGSGDH